MEMTIQRRTIRARVEREGQRPRAEPIEYRVAFALSFPVFLVSTTVRRLMQTRGGLIAERNASILAAARSAAMATAARTIPASFIG